MMSSCRFVYILFLCVSAQPAGAAVTEADAQHVVLDYTITVKAPPAKAYANAADIAHWWSSEHTYSGDAKNLHLDARAGGCWCETLPGGGSVEHLRVVFVSPGKTLRLRGALGPLQGLAVDGAMTWSVKGGTDGADISMTYAVGGYNKDGFDELSKAVDHVLAEQLERLRKLLDGEAALHGH